LSSNVLSLMLEIANKNNKVIIDVMECMHVTHSQIYIRWKQRLGHRIGGHSKMKWRGLMWGGGCGSSWEWLVYKVLNFGKAILFGGAFLLFIKCPKDHITHTDHHAPCLWRSLIVVHKEPQIPWFKAPNKPYCTCFCLEGPYDCS
jgi:hypothetical protein